MTKNGKGLHAGHRQRLRQQLLLADYTKMPEHLVTELMLTFILPYKDVNPLAHALLNEFGALANVLEADLDALKKVKGVGEVTAHYLKFCSRLPDIFASSKSGRKHRIRNVQQIVDYVRDFKKIKPRESFEYMCLNGRGEVLHFGNVGMGSAKALMSKNRELLERILKYPTHSAVIVHTIPKGKVMSTKEDIEYAENLKTLLDSLSIRLIDYVIISQEEYYSFFKNRLIEIGGPSEIEAAYRDLEMSLRDGGVDYSFDDDENE